MSSVTACVLFRNKNGNKWKESAPGAAQCVTTSKFFLNVKRKRRRTVPPTYTESTELKKTGYAVSCAALK